ncbi:hypothetical protein EV426DRAFT_597152 [Tirmania nivea]|nr:hypothetical protein EV426DRAFT_597152 [Tirmania nivea]
MWIFTCIWLLEGLQGCLVHTYMVWLITYIGRSKWLQYVVSTAGAQYIICILYLISLAISIFTDCSSYKVYLH